MSQVLAIDIDHVGIINLALQSSFEVFHALGFACGPSVQMDTGIAGEQAPTNLHFMLDNTYIECIQSNPNDYLREYLQSDAALHTLVLSSDNCQASHSALAQAGIAVAPHMVATRPADHGTNKGTASFGWFKLMAPPIPHTLLGVAEHLTRELIFQDGRYQHPNSAYLVDKVIACCDEDLTAVAVPQLCQLAEAMPTTSYHTGIRALELLTPQEIAETYQVHPDPARSHYVGLSFVVKDLALLTPLLDTAGYPYHMHNDCLVVDVVAQLNLFFLFRT